MNEDKIEELLKEFPEPVQTIKWLKAAVMGLQDSLAVTRRGVRIHEAKIQTLEAKIQTLETEVQDLKKPR